MEMNMLEISDLKKENERIVREIFSKDVGKN
jgi:hypothetical protein